MTQKPEGYLTPLDRLNLDAVNAAASPAVWLDAHQEDVVAVLKEKGIPTTSAILGLKGGTITSWLNRRKLREGILRTQEPQPRARKRRPGPGTPPAVKAARPADPASSSPRRGQASAKDPSPHHATSATAFWRGQAMAYKHALELVCRLLPGGREEP